MKKKSKLNQPDVETTTTFNGIDVPESLNVNITIPSNMMKDFMNQQSIVDFKQNHVELNHKVYGTIKIEPDVITYNGKVYTAIKEQPTIDDCLKEWEERGFDITGNNNFHLLLINYTVDNVVEIYKKDLSYRFYQWMNDESELSIPYDLHNLIHKTIKAIEVKDEKKN